MSAAQTPPNVSRIDEMRAAAPVAQLAPRRGGQSSDSIAPEATMPRIAIGFGNLQSFEFTQRVAKSLASSTMVPEAYRLSVFKKGQRGEVVQNPNAIANCIIALNMAERLRIDALEVMQGMYIVEGRPSWSSQFVISMVNRSGLFATSIKYQYKDRGPKEFVYSETYWENDTRKTRTIKATAPDLECIAWVLDKDGERVESDPVTMQLAVDEGWYGKTGSKWRTMPGQMIRYRAAAFFARVHCPELLMGHSTAEEVGDILDATQSQDGTWATETIDAENAVTKGNVDNNSQGMQQTQPDATEPQGTSAQADEPKQTEPSTTEEQGASTQTDAPKLAKGKREPTGPVQQSGTLFADPKPAAGAEDPFGGSME